MQKKNIKPWRFWTAILFVCWILPALSQELPLGQQIAERNQCLGCHSKEKKIIGPSFKGIAQRYTNSKETFIYLANKIKNGGGGVWGVVPMPANRNNITDEEIQTIIQWIFTLKENRK
jgi:cytochrome c